MLIEALHRQSGMPVENLRWLSLTASYRYKSYEIPKANGGLRTIHHPSRALKGIQRWISRFLFRRLPVHSAAAAYVRGVGIRENAAAHAGSNFTLRLDFKDFFPSFSRENIELFLKIRSDEFDLGLSLDDILFTSHIVSRYDKLTIGAPSSPPLTNVMMFDFDEQMAELARTKGLIYTRYADDLFLSSNRSNNLNDLPLLVSEISNAYPYAKLKLNNEKTAFLSKKYKRSVTGLILTTDGKISIGRSKKREIKSLVFDYTKREINDIELERLRGYVSYIKDVDPDFFFALTKKYGSSVIRDLTHKQP
ncbi:retron St85 family RNA-directed DNA polymerase [Labrys neptuniae]|uniref:RNA-directed DNA polymerase n=1 Tax=Labrys neptuniae TaxID=376174 RepID=A0ABV3PHY5_9HYPH